MYRSAKVEEESMESWIHRGQVAHICVSKLTIIASDNGLSPGRLQGIIWTNTGILLIWPLGTHFSEILIEIQRVSFKKMRLKGSSVKSRIFCLGLNVLKAKICLKIQTTDAVWNYLIHEEQWQFINLAKWWDTKTAFTITVLVYDIALFIFEITGSCPFALHLRLLCLLISFSYPLFPDADTGIHPHAASQYRARPKTNRGIAMLSVDKVPYPQKQTRGNEFHILSQTCPHH